MKDLVFKLTIKIEPGTEDEMEAVIRECIKKKQHSNFELVRDSKEIRPKPEYYIAAFPDPSDNDHLKLGYVISENEESVEILDSNLGSHTVRNEDVVFIPLDNIACLENYWEDDLPYKMAKDFLRYDIGEGAIQDMMFTDIMEELYRVDKSDLLKIVEYMFSPKLPSLLTLEVLKKELNV